MEENNAGRFEEVVAPHEAMYCDYKKNTIISRSHYNVKIILHPIKKHQEILEHRRPHLNCKLEQYIHKYIQNNTPSPRGFQLQHQLIIIYFFNDYFFSINDRFAKSYII